MAFFFYFSFLVTTTCALHGDLLGSMIPEHNHINVSSSLEYSQVFTDIGLQSGAKFLHRGGGEILMLVRTQF